MFSSLLTSCAEAKAADKIDMVMSKMKECGVPPNIFTLETLCDALIACGETFSEKHHEVFEDIVHSKFKNDDQVKKNLVPVFLLSSRSLSTVP